jgi:hypothetical protein
MILMLKNYFNLFLIKKYLKKTFYTELLNTLLINQPNNLMI